MHQISRSIQLAGVVDVAVEDRTIDDAIRDVGILFDRRDLGGDQGSRAAEKDLRQDFGLGGGDESRYQSLKMSR